MKIIKASLNNVKNTLLKNEIIRKKRHVFNLRMKPPIITNPWILDSKKKPGKVLLICVEGSFNQNVLNAQHLHPLSYGTGWANAIGPAKFISVLDLMKEIDQHEEPAIYISQHTIRLLSQNEARKLRNRDLFVWVHVHPNALEDFSQRHPRVDRRESQMYIDGYRNIILSEPKFVWNACKTEVSNYYMGWKEDGFEWQTVYPGANSKLYYPDTSLDYSNTKIAYVGGYWAEKAEAFEAYFRPFEEIFTPYGYDKWPYSHYAGGICIEEERCLYSSAGLIPLVHAPSGWDNGEITERYLKAPACGAFCIADENLAVRDIFAEDEILQASSAEHFGYLINLYMKDQIDVEKYKKNAFNAVLSRHLVEHRAVQIHEALNSSKVCDKKNN